MKAAYEVAVECSQFRASLGSGAESVIPWVSFRISAFVLEAALTMDLAPLKW